MRRNERRDGSLNGEIFLPPEYMVKMKCILSCERTEQTVRKLFMMRLWSFSPPG